MNNLPRSEIRLPSSRRGRIVLGWLLILGGVLGFLPILGFWMLPLGVAVLSVDLPWARRMRRRVVVWWGRSPYGAKSMLGLWAGIKAWRRRFRRH